MILRDKHMKGYNMMATTGYLIEKNEAYQGLCRSCMMQETENVRVVTLFLAKKQGPYVWQDFECDHCGCLVMFNDEVVS